MVQKLFIHDWDNFSETEKNYIQELINLSLKTIKVRSALLSSDLETNEADEENVSDSLSNFSKNFEVTSNPNDEAKPLGKVIPRVSAFLAVRKLFTECQNGCKNQFFMDDKKLQDCLDSCQERKTVIAEMLSFESFI